MAISKAVRCKICGITRVEDALAAVDAGADAIGLVFYPPSPRAVSLKQAQQICAALPPFVTTTALFVDAQVDEVNRVLDDLPIDLLQFHGHESAQYCAGFSRPYIKAIAMQVDTDLHRLSQTYAEAKALLLDTYKPGIPGGTGERFNWDWVDNACGKPLILAGGLTPQNVAQALHETQVYGVDVSGGVEAAKGIKCETKIHQFIQNAKQRV